MLIRKHYTNHFIITYIPELFQSDTLIEYSHKLSIHMAEQEHKNDVRADIVLPGVLGKFNDQLKAVKEILTEVIKGAAENLVLKDEIEIVVTDSIKNVTDYV